VFTQVSFGVTNPVSSFQGQIDHLVAEKGLDTTFLFLDNIIGETHTRKEDNGNVNRLQREFGTLVALQEGAGRGAQGPGRNLLGGGTLLIKN